VKQAYHIICRDCVLKFHCCGKCLDKLDPSQIEGGEEQESGQEGYSLEDLLERKPPGMKERERRRLIRELSDTDGGNKSNDDKESIDEDDSNEEEEAFEYRTRLDEVRREDDDEEEEEEESSGVATATGSTEIHSSDRVET
jgi:hypothetical protein